MYRRRPSRDPATRFLIGANVVVFLLQLLSGRTWDGLEEHLALSWSGLCAGELWQVVTYQFLHANELHIIVNMLGLWFAGRELEPVVGTPRFVALYLIGGIVGGLAQVLASPTPLIGASASVCTVMLALTGLFPSLPITALLFFVLPIQMRARTLGYILVGASILTWVSGLMPEVGHLAHLGGFATGWAFGWFFRSRLGEAPPSTPAVDSSPGSGGHLRVLPTVDEVLTKIRRYGIDSLTREDQRILEESRRSRRR